MAENPLKLMTEEELWSMYRNDKDPAIRDAFIRQYAPLVKYVAGKVAASMPNTVEFEDLVGFGVFGLLDAIEKFDPEKNVKFKTYAVTRIRGAIFDELRSIDWVPRSVRQKTKEIEDAVVNLEAKLGRPASDQEIASSMGVSEDEFLRTMLKISSTSVLSLNDVVFG
jgi:RNA polymerase sigma factor for flagellar operon FliA